MFWNACSSGLSFKSSLSESSGRMRCLTILKGRLIPPNSSGILASSARLLSCTGADGQKIQNGERTIPDSFVCIRQQRLLLLAISLHSPRARTGRARLQSHACAWIRSMRKRSYVWGRWLLAAHHRFNIDDVELLGVTRLFAVRLHSTSPKILQ